MDRSSAETMTDYHRWLVEPSPAAADLADTMADYHSKLASGLALFGAVNVPLVYLSVFFWRTQHPKAQAVASMDPRMRAPFWIAFATFTVLYVLLLSIRVRLERVRQRLDDLHLAADEAGLISD